MSYESSAEPIKVGYLMDFLLSDDLPQDHPEDLTNPLDMVFGEALRNGQLDRPVEIVYREVEGLLIGTVKAVIDAYQEPVDEGCLVIFGPSIGDNAVAIRDSLDERFRVPAISGWFPRHRAHRAPESHSATGPAASGWALVICSPANSSPTASIPGSSGDSARNDPADHSRRHAGAGCWANPAMSVGLPSPRGRRGWR